jgi:hypothetical protein
MRQLDMQSAIGAKTLPTFADRAASPTMRPASEAVKLSIANVGRFPLSNKTPKNGHPRDQKHRRLRHIRAGTRPFGAPGNALIAASGQIDENGSLPYKPRQLSAMARFDRGGSFWAGNGPLWARQHPRTYLIYQALLPG